MEREEAEGGALEGRAERLRRQRDELLEVRSNSMANVDGEGRTDRRRGGGRREDEAG